MPRRDESPDRRFVRRLSPVSSASIHRGPFPGDTRDERLTKCGGKAGETPPKACRRAPRRDESPRPRFVRRLSPVSSASIHRGPLPGNTRDEWLTKCGGKAGETSPKACRRAARRDESPGPRFVRRLSPVLSASIHRGPNLRTARQEWLTNRREEGRAPGFDSLFRKKADSCRSSPIRAGFVSAPIVSSWMGTELLCRGPQHGGGEGFSARRCVSTARPRPAMSLRR